MDADAELLAVIREALAAIEAANNRAVEAIQAERDLMAAFAAVDELATRVRQLVDLDHAIRRRIVEDIRCEQGLSLAKLANVIGVSKSRAGQYKKQVDEKRSEGEES